MPLQSDCKVYVEKMEIYFNLRLIYICKIIPRTILSHRIKSFSTEWVISKKLIVNEIIIKIFEKETVGNFEDSQKSLYMF